MKYLKDEPQDNRKTNYPADARLFFNGTDYIKKLYEVDTSKRVKVGHQTQVARLDDLIPRSEYLGLIMSLMYVARLIRPDILLPVTFLATRSHVANAADMLAAKRVLKYLRNTNDIRLRILCESLQLNMHCDASYGVHTDGKSHTGFAITLGNLLSYVMCKSAKQKLVSSSSTEAEILAMVDCLKVAIWIRSILEELDLEPLQPMKLYQDNKSAIIMTTSESKYKNAKHILTKVAYAKQLYVLGRYSIHHLKTHLMWADMLTKPLHGSLFVHHRERIMGGSTNLNDDGTA